jgi:hypothetical protein
VVWLKLEDTFHDSPKIRRAARILGIPPEYAEAYVHGTLARLWTWALRHAADGNLSGKHVDDIEIAVGWYGDNGAWVDAMINVGLLDDDDGELKIHNAKKYGGSKARSDQKRIEREAKKALAKDSAHLASNVARLSHDVAESRTTVAKCRSKEERRGEEKRERREESLLSAPSATHSTPKEPTPPPVISIPLVDKTEYGIDAKQISEWGESYPAVDVLQELRKAREWAISNPTKRKTNRGIRKHLTGWLSGAQDMGGNTRTRSQPASVGYHPGSDASKFITGKVKL